MYVEREGITPTSAKQGRGVSRAELARHGQGVETVKESEKDEHSTSGEGVVKRERAASASGGGRDFETKDRWSDDGRRRHGTRAAHAESHAS